MVDFNYLSLNWLAGQNSEPSTVLEGLYLKHQIEGIKLHGNTFEGIISPINSILPRFCTPSFQVQMMAMMDPNLQPKAAKARNSSYDWQFVDFILSQQQQKRFWFGTQLSFTKSWKKGKFVAFFCLMSELWQMIELFLVCLSYAFS